MTSSTSAAADRLKAESFGVRIAPGDWEDHDVVLLSVALKIVEAQQTDDTLSELRTKIAIRILTFKNVRPVGRVTNSMEKVARIECDTAVRQLEWVLKSLDSAKAPLLEMFYKAVRENKFSDFQLALEASEAQQTDDTLSELRTVTMANQYKGKELWEVQIGGETAYYVGTLEEVIEKAKTHENYLHDEPLRGKPKPDQWNAGYPIGKIEKVGTLAG